MSRNIVLVAIVVIIVLALGGWWALSQTGQVPQDNITGTFPEGQLPDTAGPADTTPAPTSTTHEITYTDAGFAPANATIKVGDTVTWKNQSSTNMWVGSAMHPSHMVYSGTNLQTHCPDTENNDFDQCKGEAPGTSWSFTFTKAGSWGYHDHLTPSKFGKITVE